MVVGDSPDQEEARSRDVGEAGDEVPGPDDYIGDEGEDEFDQNSPTEMVQRAYEETGGELPIAVLLKEQYLALQKMDSAAIAHFTSGKYKEM